MGLIIGIPKETSPYEYRVGMTPAGVSILTEMGHQCYVESGAGDGSGFSDTAFEQAGARITYNHEEAFRRADLLLKVLRPSDAEIDTMKDGQIMMSMMMLAGVHERTLNTLRGKSASIVAYEMIRDDDDRLPVLYPLSQIGGRMAAQVAAQFLQNNHGGHGILLGGIASVPPAEVVVLGAGVVGMNAADAFLRYGARVILMDRDLRKLQTAHDRFDGHVTTMVSHDFNLKRVCKFADVLVGAVQIPGQRAPVIITREMVRSMRPGSLIMDMSIDQGGCVATSRPTTHDDPVFVAEDVLHYCVLNMPGVVGRTATHAFLNAAWPYIMRVVEAGLSPAAAADPTFKRGVIMTQGQLTFNFGR
jgi:alanine dehydrogenase